MSEPEDTQYLRLANGRVVNGSTGHTTVDTSKNKLYSNPSLDGSKAKPTFSEGTRRYLDDLRMPPFDSRRYAIIAAYSMFGLSDADIAYLLSTNIDAVAEAKDSKEYAHILDGILQNVREHDKDKVRKILNASAEDAAATIRDIAKNKAHSKQFAAAQDILNRTGHGGDADTGDKKSGGITIRIIKPKDKDADIDIGVL